MVFFLSVKHRNGYPVAATTHSFPSHSGDGQTVAYPNRRPRPGWRAIAAGLGIVATTITGAVGCGSDTDAEPGTSNITAESIAADLNDEGGVAHNVPIARGVRVEVNVSPESAKASIAIQDPIVAGGRYLYPSFADGRVAFIGINPQDPNVTVSPSPSPAQPEKLETSSVTRVDLPYIILSAVEGGTIEGRYSWLVEAAGAHAGPVLLPRTVVRANDTASLSGARAAVCTR